MALLVPLGCTWEWICSFQSFSKAPIIWVLGIPDAGLGTMGEGVWERYKITDDSLGLCVTFFEISSSCKRWVAFLKVTLLISKDTDESTLTQALASKNLVSFISLGWPRPGQMDQGLTLVPLSAGDTVHILQLTSEERTAPQTTPKRNYSVWSVGLGWEGCQVFPVPCLLSWSVHCRAQGVPKPSSPSGLCQKFAS